MNKMKYILLLFLTLWFSTHHISAQAIRASVQVTMGHLQPRDQQDLADLQQRLTNYINTRQWSDENQDIVLECNLQLLVETVTNRGSEKLYRSQFLISSPSGENFRDQAWEFKYVPGQAMDAFRTLFDPLLDLIDFYIFMVIAGEMDTYQLFGGTPFYDRCLDIANQGMLSEYSMGWKSRQQQVTLITDADHVALREAKFYYYETLYFVEEEPDPEKARLLAKAVIDRLKQLHTKRPNSPALKRFMDAHYQEICRLFTYDTDRKNIEALPLIDPRHRDTYRDCQPGG